MTNFRHWHKCRTVTAVLSALIFVVSLINFTKEQHIPVKDLRDSNSQKVIHRADFTKYELFEPEVLEDFPTNNSGKAIIPHILHQTYKDERIPEVFVPFVKSCQTHNPSWKYYLWTDESARRLIVERHPSFLPVWDNYKSKINRADALRYFVLYEFGGVYADLDVECLRPLDKATTMFAAIFPPEPIEHCLRLHIPFLLSNAIMMSRPKHPFLKQVIDSISNFQPMSAQIDIAGPSFVTAQFMIYNKFKPGDAYKFRKETKTNSPYFYKGELNENDINAVYVPNTHYFMHTLNMAGVDKKYYDRKCKTKNISHDIIVRRGCHEYWLRATIENPNRFTFTEHHWYQTYNFPIRTFQHLSKVLRNYTIY